MRDEKGKRRANNRHLDMKVVWVREIERKREREREREREK